MQKEEKRKKEYESRVVATGGRKEGRKEGGRKEKVRGSKKHGRRKALRGELGKEEPGQAFRPLALG